MKEADLKTLKPDKPLKPCPFCGGVAYSRVANHADDNGSVLMAVECEQCEATLEGCPDLKEAKIRFSKLVYSWNSRIDTLKEDDYEANLDKAQKYGVELGLNKASNWVMEQAVLFFKGNQNDKAELLRDLSGKIKNEA